MQKNRRQREKLRSDQGASRFGLLVRTIRRLRYGLPQSSGSPRGNDTWTAKEERLLGIKPDPEVTRLLKRLVSAVSSRQKLKGIFAFLRAAEDVLSLRLT